jgi:hypothetical protein
MKLNSTEGIHNVEWDSLVAAHPDGGFYHTTMWSNILSKTYNFVPDYLVFRDQFNQIRAGMPIMITKDIIGRKKLACLPFTPHCNPLVSEDDELNRLLVKVFDHLVRTQSHFLEIRTLGRHPGYSRFQFSQNKNFVTHVLDLNSDLASIRQSFHRSCIQRPIRKAKQNNLSLYISNDIRDVKEFYRLQLLTRKKHGVPPQPLKFFTTMWNELHDRGFMDLLLAINNGEAIAGIIVLKYKKTAIYQNGASNKTHLKLHPNHFLLWESIKRVHCNGFRYLDLGRSGIDEQGLIQFKDRWGAIKHILTYYFYPGLSGATVIEKKSWKYRVFQKFFHSAPIGVSKLIGTLCYRFLG